MAPSPAFRTPAALSRHIANALIADFDTFEVGTGRSSDDVADGQLLADPSAVWTACEDGFPSLQGGDIVFVSILGDGEGEFPHRERVVRARRKSDGAVIAVTPRFVGQFGVKECGEWVARIRYTP